MPSGQADYKVEIVDDAGQADMKVAVVGDQVVDLTGATDGEVLTVQADGTVAPEAPAAGSGFATPAIALGTAAAAGAASTVIRSDSTIIAFDATVPTTQAFGDAAAVGAAAVAARRDHKHAMPTDPSSALVAKSLYDANTILKADTDDTPAALTMGASTILARLAAGAIKAATPAELRTLLSLVIGTDVQAYDADLDAIAALTTATFGRSLLTGVDAAAVKTLLAIAESDVTNLVTDLAAKAAKEMAHSQRRGAADFPDLGGATWSNIGITATDKLVNRNNGTGTINDALGYDFWLPSGTYRIDLLTAKASNAGVATPNVDGTDLATVDLYAASTAFFATSWTGIAVASAGVKRVKFTMASKNASSSGYDLSLIQLAISRTGA